MALTKNQAKLEVLAFALATLRMKKGNFIASMMVDHKDPADMELLRKAWEDHVNTVNSAVVMKEKEVQKESIPAGA